MASMICILHMKGDGPGLVGLWAQSRHIPVRTVELYAGEALPEPADDDMVLIMGGSMGAYEEDSFPWLGAEKAYLKRQIARRIPCFGICLGAQLLSECIGGSVTKNGIAEIGHFPVTFHKEALALPLLSGVASSIVPLHWHRDTFSIPAGTAALGASEACERQGFYDGDRRILGFQFHIEADEKLGGSWAEEEPAEIAEAGLLPQGRFIQTAERMRELGAVQTAGNKSFLYTVLDRFFGSAVQG